MPACLMSDQRPVGHGGGRLSLAALDGTAVVPWTKVIAQCG